MYHDPLSGIHAISFNGRIYNSVSGYDRQMAPGVTGPAGFVVNKYSIGTTIRLVFPFRMFLVQIIIIISQYEEMSLAHLKCILRKGDARVMGRKLELFQQARTAESHTSHTRHRLEPNRGVCLTYLMLEHYFKVACNV